MAKRKSREWDTPLCIRTDRNTDRWFYFINSIKYRFVALFPFHRIFLKAFSVSVPDINDTGANTIWIKKNQRYRPRLFYHLPFIRPLPFQIYTRFLHHIHQCLLYGAHCVVSYSKPFLMLWLSDGYVSETEYSCISWGYTYPNTCWEGNTWRWVKWVAKVSTTTGRVCNVEFGLK